MKKKIMPSAPPIRSFRLAYEGGIVLPGKNEWYAFYHSRHGISFLLVILLINSLYANILAVPPSARALEISNVFVAHRDAAFNKSLSDEEYRAAIPPLLQQHNGWRSGTIEAVMKGSVTTGILDEWQAHIENMRGSLLTMTISGAMKEVHLGLVSALDQEERAVYSLREHGLTAETQLLIQNSFERYQLLMQAYPWIATSGVELK